MDFQAQGPRGAILRAWVPPDPISSSTSTRMWARWSLRSCSRPDLLEIVTSANIATGAHAGNVEVMEAAVTYAANHGVAVGAHPSSRDREGFGRRVIQVSTADLRADLLAQVGTLVSIARFTLLRVRHVKPHGALYHRMSADESCARTFEDVVAEFDGPASSFPRDLRCSGTHGSACGSSRKPSATAATAPTERSFPEATKGTSSPILNRLPNKRCR